MAPMFGVLARVLAAFYAVWPSYAFAIVALTSVVYLALLPLGLRQAKAMTAMQHLQPQLRALRERHKGDRQRLNEETMALYQRHAVNPAATFLPMVVQLPVMVVMYRVVRGLTYNDAVTGQAAPRYLDHGSKLYQALQDHGGRMLSGGIDLSTSALAPHDSVLAAVPFFVLAGLVVGAAVWQQRLSRRTASSPVPAGSRHLMRVMPAFTGMLAISLPAGVTLYYLVSSLFRIGQQQLIRGHDAPSSAAPHDGERPPAHNGLDVSVGSGRAPEGQRAPRARKRQAAKRRKRAQRR
jgi:YidC/Oxa1 family membrane protein insertase